MDGKFHIRADDPVAAAGAPSSGVDGGVQGDQKANAWYKEVLKRRKQAGEYRVSYNCCYLPDVNF